MVSLKVIFQEGEFVDKIDLSQEEFYQKMRESKKLPITSQVNPDEFVTLFERALEQGDEVLGIFISSDLSGTYQSAVIAKEMVGREGIYLVDSRTVSFGLAALIYYVTERRDQGATILELQEEVTQLTSKVELYGVLNTLDNLEKGGRLSKTGKIIGNILSLKPIIQVSEGKVQVAHKARGRQKSIQWLLERIQEAFGKEPIERIYIAHGNEEEQAKELKTAIEGAFSVKESTLIEIGSVVGTHAGEGAFGISFIRK